MQKILLLLFSAFIISCNNTQQVATTYKHFEATNTLFEYNGRLEHTNEAVELINSAASVKAILFGDSIVIHMESANEQHHYVSIELNEEYIGRYRIKNEPLQLSLPTNDDGNLLKIYKDTEASNGGILFKGISALKIGPLPKTKNPKIEFIGNSITCGMGADTREISCEEGEWYDQHNAYLAYGPRVARALNVDFELSCVSGMGMYRNWNDEDQPVMPTVYSNLRLNEDAAKKANFSKNPPAIVSIALGTNDLSLGDGEKARENFNEQKFINNYIAFIENIYSYYPETKVVLLSSPMVGEKENKILISSLKKIQSSFSSKEIEVFEFEKMEPQGCTSHPNIEDHEEMANMLIPFFKEILQKI